MDVFFTETNNKLCDCLWHCGNLVFFLPSYIICLFRLGIPNVGSLDHHKPKKTQGPKDGRLDGKRRFFSKWKLAKVKNQFWIRESCGWDAILDENNFKQRNDRLPFDFEDPGVLLLLC